MNNKFLLKYKYSPLDIKVNKIKFTTVVFYVNI